MWVSSKKKMQNKLDVLQESVDKLSTLIETNELGKLREEKSNFDEAKEKLKVIKSKISLKEIRCFDGEEVGSTNLRIVFNPIAIMLHIDGEGKITTSEFLKSANALDLINTEDQVTISRHIQMAKNKKS